MNHYIASDNISWATQQNIPAGTEKHFVLACKQEFKTSKRCCKNAVNLLIKNGHKKSLALIGFQEATALTADLFLKPLQKAFPSLNYKIVSSETYNNALVATIYSETLLGKATQLLSLDIAEFSKKKKEGIPYSGLGRPLQVIYFSKKDLLLINAHYPHKMSKNYTSHRDYQSILTNTIKKLEKKSNKLLTSIKRVILTGDFNDINYSPRSKLSQIEAKKNPEQWKDYDPKTEKNKVQNKSLFDLIVNKKNI